MVLIVGPLLIPANIRPSRCNMEFGPKANNNRLKGQHCLTEHFIEKGPAVCPLMWIEETAWSYMFLSRVSSFLLKPYFVNTLKRCLWEILSKASEMSRDRIYRGTCFLPAYAFASRIVAPTSKMLASGTPQC